MLKPLSYKFIACVFTVLLLTIAAIWSLYRLTDMLATQAFTFCIGSIVTIVIAYITGNVLGDHFIDKKSKGDH